jgi:hypothetical protein
MEFDPEECFPVSIAITSNITRNFIRVCWGITDDQIESYLSQGMTLQDIDDLYRIERAQD